MADNATAIAELENILQAGATEVTVDGQTVKYDFAAIRKRLRHLKNTDDEATRRPLSYSVDLSGF